MKVKLDNKVFSASEALKSFAYTLKDEDVKIYNLRAMLAISEFREFFMQYLKLSAVLSYLGSQAKTPPFLYLVNYKIPERLLNAYRNQIGFTGNYLSEDVDGLCRSILGYDFSKGDPEWESLANKLRTTQGIAIEDTSDSYQIGGFSFTKAYIDLNPLTEKLIKKVERVSYEGNISIHNAKINKSKVKINIPINLDDVKHLGRRN